MRSLGINGGITHGGRSQPAAQSMRLDAFACLWAMMNEPHSSSEERDIRAALQYAVAQICMEEEMSDASTHMSAQAVAALSELVFQ